MVKPASFLEISRMVPKNKVRFGAALERGGFRGSRSPIWAGLNVHRQGSGRCGQAEKAYKGVSVV